MSETTGYVIEIVYVRKQSQKLYKKSSEKFWWLEKIVYLCKTNKDRNYENKNRLLRFTIT
jgi:hypothetical protein